MGGDGVNNGKRKIWLPDVVGKHYADFWHFRGRYR